METYTLDDLVGMFGHSRDWWLRRCQRGEIPHQKYGRAYRFDDDDIAAIKDQHRHRPRDPLASLVTKSRRAS